MFGKGKKAPAVQEVVIRPAVSRRDVVRHESVVAGPVRGPSKVRRAVKIRRSAPIRAYVGPNGQGKSLAAVMDLMPSLQRGRPVLSTVPLLDWNALPGPEFIHDPEVGKWVHFESGAYWIRPTHPSYRRLTEWSQIMDFEQGDIFLDEVAGVASSRQHTGLPAAIERLLQKLRKGDITLSWTAPAWARADLIIREVTQAVTVSRGTRPEKHEVEGRLWKRNRQFTWETFDASTYTDWTEGKKDKAVRMCRQTFWGPGSDVFNAYDTLGAVDTITSVTDAGRCVSCGGTRRAPECSCHDYRADREARKGEHRSAPAREDADRASRSTGSRGGPGARRPAPVSK